MNTLFKCDQKIKFFFITSSPELAAFAVENGVDRIFVDLEVLGKDARQGHLNTVISLHRIEDVSVVRKAVPEVDLMVRLNPINPSTHEEIERSIESGADILMLPMFKTPEEVEYFTKAVDGRAKVCLLVETIGAMHSLRECVTIVGVNEVHIGLNDLHLEMGNAFMFEPLANGFVDDMAAILREVGIPFGIGGIARFGEGLLRAEIILAEHIRLGSTAAIISRTFHRNAATVELIKAEIDFAGEINKLRQAYSQLQSADSVTLAQLHGQLKQSVSEISATIRLKAVQQKEIN